MAIVISGEQSVRFIKDLYQINVLKVFPDDIRINKYTATTLKAYWDENYSDYLKYSGLSKMSASCFSLSGVKAEVPITLTVSSGSDIINKFSQSFINDNFSICHFTNLPKPKKITIRCYVKEYQGYYIHSGLFFKSLSGNNTVYYPFLVTDGGNAVIANSKYIYINNKTESLTTNITPDEQVVLEGDNLSECFKETANTHYEMILVGCNKYHVNVDGKVNQPLYSELNVFF